jgi:type IV fimbrial biogenesis protein FimT
MEVSLRRPRGFTLIEAMVGIAIMVILMSVAVPSLRAYIQTQVVRNTASELSSALMLARSEAILRRANVRVEAESGDFLNGWKVLAGTTVLREQAAVADVAITASATTITYALDGRSNSAVTLLVAPPTGSASLERRCVSIDTTGMPRVRKTTGSC